MVPPTLNNCLQSHAVLSWFSRFLDIFNVTCQVKALYIQNVNFSQSKEPQF